MCVMPPSCARRAPWRCGAAHHGSYVPLNRMASCQRIVVCFVPCRAPWRCGAAPPLTSPSVSCTSAPGAGWSCCGSGCVLCMLYLLCLRCLPCGMLHVGGKPAVCHELARPPGCRVAYCPGWCSRRFVLRSSGRRQLSPHICALPLALCRSPTSPSRCCCAAPTR